MEDLRLHWRSYRPYVVVPLLGVITVAVVVFAVVRNDRSNDGLTALRTDAPPTSVAAGQPEPNALTAPELLSSGEAGGVLEVAEEQAAADADDATTTTSGPTTTVSITAVSTTTTETSVAPTSDPDTTDSASTSDPSTTDAPSTSEAPTTTQAPTTEAPTTEPPATDAPPTTAAPSNCQGGGQFELVFRDDFNGSSLGSAWREYNSIGNNGFGLRRSSANSVANGMLTITAEMQDGQLVSGGMAHNYDQQYGKYVFRVRTDDDPNQATSGVILTWPESQVHPRDGENNIYETLAHTPERTQFFSVIHKPFGQRGDQEYFIHRANGAVFQTMTMEWLPDRITITRQGDDPSDRNVVEVIETAADLVPDNPHHVAIQLDAWKHEMQGTVQMMVDYIEVHRYCG